RTTTGFINGADTAATYTLPNPPDDTFNNLREVLGKRRYRTLTEKVGNETHIYADKNRFSGFGTFPFHIGL
ncbi:cytochrome c biogenesis protein ResB, partial [Campylobacter jejuni]